MLMIWSVFIVGYISSGSSFKYFRNNLVLSIMLILFTLLIKVDYFNGINFRWYKVSRVQTFANAKYQN